MAQEYANTTREMIQLLLTTHIMPYLDSSEEFMKQINTQCPLFSDVKMCCVMTKRTNSKEKEKICGKFVKKGGVYCTFCVKKIKEKSTNDKSSIELVLVGDDTDMLYWNPENNQIYAMISGERLILVGKRKANEIKYVVSDRDIQIAADLGIKCELE